MSGSIGSNNFPFMVGEVPQIVDGIELIEKPGRDGFIRRNIGKRAPDFALLTRGHYSSMAAARQAFYGLTQLIGDEAQTFEKDNVNYTTAPITQDHIKVVVLGVELTELSKRAHIVGTTDKFEMVLTWSLRPVLVVP